MTRTFRVAYFVSHPIQYQAPMLRYIANDPSLELRVFFANDSSGGYRDDGFGRQVEWDIPLLQGFEYEFLPSWGTTTSPGFWRPFTRQLTRRLKAGRFDAVWIHGYGSASNLLAIRAARSLDMKVLIRGESQVHVSRSARSGVARKLLQYVCGYVDAFLAIGKLNRDFYSYLGVSPERIFLMPYCVDNDFFRTKAREASASREELRRSLQMDDRRPVILFASKLTARKRATDLLAAYEKLSHRELRRPYPYLVFIGDGPEKGDLLARIARLDCPSVKFLGFKNQSELPSYYNLCDLFVLPSEREPWGLAVNEAMNAERAILVSDHVGAGADLVEEGRNGHVFQCGNVRELASLLSATTADGSRLLSMGKESGALIRDWNFAADLRGLKAALNYVCA